MRARIKASIQSSSFSPIRRNTGLYSLVKIYFFCNGGDVCCFVLCTRLCTHIINFSPTPATHRLPTPKKRSIFLTLKTRRCGNRKSCCVLKLPRQSVTPPPNATRRPTHAYSYVGYFLPLFLEGKSASWMEKCCGKMRLRFFLLRPQSFTVCIFQIGGKKCFYSENIESAELFRDF